MIYGFVDFVQFVAIRSHLCKLGAAGTIVAARLFQREWILTINYRAPCQTIVNRIQTQRGGRKIITSRSPICDANARQHVTAWTRPMKSARN